MNTERADEIEALRAKVAAQEKALDTRWTIIFVLIFLLLTCPAMACEPGVDVACTPANAVVAMAAPDPALVSCTSANAGLIEINSQLVAREQALAARVAELEAAMKQAAKPQKKRKRR